MAIIFIKFEMCNDLKFRKGQYRKYIIVKNPDRDKYNSQVM